MHTWVSLLDLRVMYYTTFYITGAQMFLSLMYQLANKTIACNCCKDRQILHSPVSSLQAPSGSLAALAPRLAFGGLCNQTISRLTSQQVE